MEMNIVEKDVAARIKKNFKDRCMIIGRTANITVPHNGRTNCQYRNKCALGCPFGGYFSTQASTLPAAVKTGNLTLRPFSIVTKILYDKDTKKAKGVQIIDAETNQTYEYFAKVIFLERIYLKLKLGANEFGYRCLGRRLRQQQRRTGPQPDGSPL
jgi:choline dehydrogenase-like flavoprotein